MAKRSILPVLAIGGIVGAVFLMGGKKKKVSASTQPVAPGPLECPQGSVPYDRVQADPGDTFYVRACVPADMVEAMTNAYGAGVEITMQEIAAWERGERWMVEAGKGEPPATGFAPAAGNQGGMTRSFSPAQGGSTRFFDPGE